MRGNDVGLTGEDAAFEEAREVDEGLAAPDVDVSVDVLVGVEDEEDVDDIDDVDDGLETAECAGFGASGFFASGEFVAPRAINATAAPPAK